MLGQRIHRVVWDDENGLIHAFSFLECQCGLAFKQAYELRDSGLHGYVTSERETRSSEHRVMWDIEIIEEF